MFSLSKTLGILPTLSSNLSASGPLKHYGNYSPKHQSLSSLHGNGYTVQSNKIKPTNISWESVMCNCVEITKRSFQTYLAASHTRSVASFLASHWE